MLSAPSFWHCKLSAVQPSSPGTQHGWILSPPMLSGPGLVCSLSLPPRSFLEELQGTLLSTSSRHDPLMCKQERRFVLSGKQRGNAESTLPSMDGARAERALPLCTPLKPLRSPARALLFAPQECQGHNPTPPCLHMLYLQPLPCPGPPFLLNLSKSSSFSKSTMWEG